MLKRVNSVVAVLGCLLVALTAEAAATPGKGSAKSSVPTFTPVELPQSTFTVPANPRDGRNPFFPQSIVAAPVFKPKEGASIDLAGFVLNGITSPPKRTAMINGRTFEPGEEGEVRLPSGAKALVKCEEIRADSAVILVNGLRRELRLRLGL